MKEVTQGYAAPGGWLIGPAGAGRRAGWGAARWRGAATPEMVPSSLRVSAQMSRLPSKDTQPEIALRRLLFGRGFRYRLHVRVPGLPRRTVDIAFPGIKVA
jgi:hypothetical protein